jgi:hypothetical protein
VFPAVSQPSTLYNPVMRGKRNGKRLRLKRKRKMRAYIRANPRYHFLREYTFEAVHGPVYEQG